VAATDVALALVTVALWGVAFVATRIGLDSFSPAQLVALRFLIAAAPVLFVRRPPVAWPVLIAAGLTLYAGQFLFQFFGIASGMPPGLASLVVQTQALFTVLFAALVLRERPTARQTLGLGIALTGLAVIGATAHPGATAGSALTLLGFGLTLVSPISFAIGNVYLKKIGVQTIGGTADSAIVAWMSLVPPLPALVLSFFLDGAGGLAHAVVAASWAGWLATLYLGLLATVVAYTIWGRLLRRYPVASVAPFALLVPFVGALSSALVLGERFGPLRLLGMAFVLLGLGVIVMPGLRSRSPRAATP
jgi:O-acetylserine/cysteine efflux transporter